MTEKLGLEDLRKELVKKWEPNAICDICFHRVIMLFGDKMLSTKDPRAYEFTCNLNDKIDCIGHSKFVLKPKSKWYEFKVMNFQTNKWEIIKLAHYKRVPHSKEYEWIDIY
jgi:hypothetical protein